MDNIAKWKRKYTCSFKILSQTNKNIKTLAFIFHSVIQHEFLHTIGAYHVQSRSDRDTYVTIKWNNIKPGYKNQFTKKSKAPTYGLPYDGLSIMHYEFNNMAKDQNKPTIVSKVCT